MSLSENAEKMLLMYPKILKKTLKPNNSLVITVLYDSVIASEFENCIKELDSNNFIVKNEFGTISITESGYNYLKENGLL